MKTTYISYKTNAASTTARLLSRFRLRCLLSLSFIIFHLSFSVAQISIGGNVYGGGNAGNTGGSTSVTVRAGDIDGSVYGGARMANVGGSAFVNIDGEHISDDILINYVYGGNDIAGTIGTGTNLPSGLTETTDNGIDNSYNTFVLTTQERTVTTGTGDQAVTKNAFGIYIGQVFGGGNGDYKYDDQSNGKYSTKVDGVDKYDLVKPEVDKAYLEIRGGSIVILYGGGNNATVNQATDICIDNPSIITNNIYEADGITSKFTDKRLRRMGIYQLGGAGENVVTSDEYQFSRVFGGNNKAPMAIRPRWHLKQGRIRNLYSGGNRGNMTYENGIFLNIEAAANPSQTSMGLTVGNVYGGCRMANVNPDKHSIAEETIEGTLCPPGYAARVHIGGGIINNVYGGNDVSGTVFGGNAVGIHSSILGNVYGGGNGSYPYTDNKDLATSDLYGDYYYDVNELLGKSSGYTFSGKESAQALNLFRPNAEAVSVRLIGTQTNPTIIGGAVYCGGNSATLVNNDPDADARAQLKIGSYVYADKVFLGSNGANMITEEVLKQIAGTEEGKDFSQMALLDADEFKEYMKGCELDIKPQVVFDSETGSAYQPYSTYFGSFYCGGNVGSVRTNGMNTIDFNYKVIIFDKLVGGCNNAFIPATTYNAAYNGGILDTDANGYSGNKLTLNLSGLELRPMRWKDPNDKSQLLEWNTFIGDNPDDADLTTTGQASPDDKNRRFKGGNIYGGCYTSGIVEGNVIINVDATLIDNDVLFDKVTQSGSLYGDNILTQDDYNIEERRTGVILAQQGMDVLGTALNVFGGGKGKDTEIWGSTTINLNKGYVFQVFGGSEQGVIGKSTGASTASDGTYADGKYSFNGKSYAQNDKYSCTVNLRGSNDGVASGSSTDMAEAIFIYGGGYLGPICGNTIINLGKGRIFNSFAGSCNADILGHTETYIGRQIASNGTAGEGFPYISDYVYGGNDLGGNILGTGDFTSRVRTDAIGSSTVASMMHDTDMAKDVSAYVEYLQGHAIGIFGGCFGTYNYTDAEYSDFFDSTTGGAKTGYTKPRMDKAFVNFRPTSTAELKRAINTVGEVYGAGQGYPGDGDRDIMQNSSYILIDIPQDMNNYRDMQVWGAGAWSGLGMREYVAPDATDAARDAVSAVIDLARGQIGSVYGGSYREGFTRRSVVNVPEESTIKLNKIFGGAFGVSNDAVCDVYEANVNYNSADATVGALYGGNNSYRRTLYGRMNITVPVWSDKTNQYLANVYGAGYGENTWSQYTEVNLLDGAQVSYVYGGGENGRVTNAPTAKKMAQDVYHDLAGLKIANSYTVGNETFEYADNGLDNPLAVARHDGKKYNTNVIIHRGAQVGIATGYTDGDTRPYARYGGYAFGGGMGTATIPNSGDVNGTTYIALLGGTVWKDLYAAGRVGAVLDSYGNLNDDFNQPFKAGTTAFIGGGTARNVYGGGYMGSVGYHVGEISDTPVGDIEGESHVIIGIRRDQTEKNLLAALTHVKGSQATIDDYGFYCGMPAIQRNAYGGGEGEEGKGGRGGAIYGTANLTLNNGCIGYEYDGHTQTKYAPLGYREKLNDETWLQGDSIGRLIDYGNLFGGGYSDKSNVDYTNVVVYGGIIRSSVHGGAEIAAIGRGATQESGSANATREFQAIYKPGKTHVEIYNGHVLHNVFGGGKGYNVLGFGGANELYTDGYVFGQTEVYIFGGDIGTEEGLADGYGNVFGGGDVGFVYSKGYTNPHSRITDTGSPGHYYYYYNDYKCTSAYGNYSVDDVIPACIYDAMTDADKAHWTAASHEQLVEDCKVVVSPYLQVKDRQSVTYQGHTYNAFDYVPTEYLNTLPKKETVTDSKGNTTKQFTGDWLKLYTGVNNGVEGATEDTEERGVHIRNAVFAGGNVSSNSDKTYANQTTVFGNTSATLYDVFHRDFITVGTEHTGGIYGGGNLSVVDGYRELNITNYGTDYYGLESQITLDEYKSLSNRERAYFQLKYVCIANSETNTENKAGITIDGVFYTEGTFINEDEYLKLLEKRPNDVKSAFEAWGFCSIYAGRLLNTIQRADLCGVFGSRLVLQGAKDRVADVGEDIDYTINRVGEVSLNQQRSIRTEDLQLKTGAAPGSDDFLDPANALHGNYFGIYSVVNYMGHLTSDVHFSDPYRGTNGDVDNTLTYYSYKSNDYTSSQRNFGSSFNQVALASGVFLELTTENSTATHKDYGYVTGVIELDLINVRRDELGGGFVYAKNEHRVPLFYPDRPYVLLSEYNQLTGNVAITYKQFRYSEDQEGEWGTNYVIIDDTREAYSTVPYETSGNFIHPQKKIIDDCYPTNNAYIIGSANYSEAHYWYVKGDVYIYDQKVSAYTGSANAYSKEVHLPLTITAASHGRLQLINVKPNLYAYYMPTNDTGTDKAKIGSVDDANGKAIDKVYVNNDADSYELNDVITWWDWHHLSAAERAYFVTQTYVNCITCTIDGTEYEAGTYVMDDADFTAFKSSSHTITNAAGENATVDFVFRSSNNIGHDTGYLLTLDMNTPKKWDNYYTLINSSNPATTISNAEYQELSLSDQSNYIVGPTFSPLTSGVYGQRQYDVGDVITEGTFENSTAGSGEQATMEEAYVATSNVSYTYQGQQKTANAGTAIPETEYNALSTTEKASFGRASTCTSTVKLSAEKYMLYGELYTAAQIQELKDTYASVKNNEGTITGYTSLADEIDLAMTPAYICSKAGGFGGRQFYNTSNYDAIASWCSLPKSDRIDDNGSDLFTFNYDALDLLASPSYLTVSGTATPTHANTEAAFHSPYTDEVAVEYSAVFNGETAQTVEFTDGTSRSFSPTDSDADKRLTNEQFEKVRNDQHHYTRVSVKSGGEYIYIAKNHFIYNGIPYGTGQVIDNDIAIANPSDVEQVHFNNSSAAAVIQYYCYEDYGSVNKGAVIDQTEYSALPNHQKYFIIQGQEPTETTTLYVSRESDIYDLTKEKIITVVYQYTYYEDEDDGSVKLTNELHVINIHLELESGVPQIGQLNPPSTVLPGAGVGMKAPEVKPGLYEILTSGWELFDTYEEAIKHQNGVPFTNNYTPVYWYQHQKAYVAFYSKTYLGKTYSNPVPLSVANYHDLKNLLGDPVHLHIDYDPSLLQRDCKVYVNDYSQDATGGTNGLTMLSDLVDLTYGDADAVNTYGAFTTPTNITGGANLDIILRTDLTAPSDASTPSGFAAWTPIANADGQCFSGTLHGDGHHVSGIDNSLFGHLCGQVYNLGAMGSFTTAGIADQGSGYMENCWVKSSATSGFAADTYPVFGKPSRTGSDLIQVVNCYYPVSNPYQLPSGTHTHGVATQMPDSAFYNGGVTYNLNGFYLNKRYYEGSQQAEPATSDRPELTSGSSYVVDRYADGDFIYANGTIPTDNDVRLRSKTTGEGENAVTTYYYEPIWPDDYLFFGQALNYGHVTGLTHQDVPSSIGTSNRVFRAPAYFRSSTMGVAHFNADAVFAQSKKGDANTIAYKGMTAIDFTGTNDGDWGRGTASGGSATGFFYPPLLDDNGLTDFTNADLTKNLLVYTGTGTEAAIKTDDVISTKLHDYAYAETNDTYHTVAAWDIAANWKNMYGHWVQKQSDGTFMALSDQLLVDQNETDPTAPFDFNAPFPYTFDSGKRMWYQRKNPDNRFVDDTKGWDAISLPFSPVIVTTQDKGELTHFYSGSTTGHEYWLREFTGIGTGADASTITALLTMLNAGANEKEYTNTFLYDHYYSNQSGLDANSDVYQSIYYSSSHTFNDYPYPYPATPYLLGLPGERYYEFDLSGTWTPLHTTEPAPASVGKQTVTFASATGITIGVSDTEIANGKVKQGDNYFFKPTYMETSLSAGGGYALNNDGSAFSRTTEPTTVLPFRPYFTKTVAAGSRGAEHIVFGNATTEFGIDDDADNASEGLSIYSRRRTIVVESSMSRDTDVTIVSPEGVELRSFTIQPGETVTTRVSLGGIYIINSKKIVVR